ncbi:MAG TPA: DinB family protein [Verrucomicrobiae bacterium]|nr:DinB family protein [Verrucomicrobiae bacterium]
MRNILVCLVLTAAVAGAQENPLSAFNRTAYGQVKNWLLGSAQKMPEENYSFKPAETVRSFGQLVGHVADAQYIFCSVVLSDKNPDLKIEQSTTSKADLIAALKSAFAYCDRAYNSMTDASATQMYKLYGTDMPKLDVLTVNIMHSAEHYGNMVTYLRMKNIVPPSTEQMSAPPTRK